MTNQQLRDIVAFTGAILSVLFIGIGVILIFNSNKWRLWGLIILCMGILASGITSILLVHVI